MTRVLVVLALAALAGCAAPVGTLPPPEGADAPGSIFESASCDEGGGYVVWNPDGAPDPAAAVLPEPFVYADASEDLGRPPVTASGAPSGAMLEGAYHAVITCPEWSMGGVAKKDLVIALVLGRIEPPPFDPAPLEREYVVAVLGVNDPDLEAALIAVGVVPDALLSASLSSAGGVHRSTMQFGHHGDIISVVPIEAAGEKPSETMRLWILAPDEDGLRTFPLDLVDVGGQRFIAPSPGHFDHRAPSAAPPAPGVPLHEFSSWALAYQGVERSLRLGPAVNVTLGGDHGHAR